MIQSFLAIIKDIFKTLPWSTSSHNNKGGEVLKEAKHFRLLLEEVLEIVVS